MNKSRLSQNQTPDWNPPPPPTEAATASAGRASSPFGWLRLAASIAVIAGCLGFSILYKLKWSESAKWKRVMEDFKTRKGNSELAARKIVEALDRLGPELQDRAFKGADDDLQVQLFLHQWVRNLRDIDMSGSDRDLLGARDELAAAVEDYGANMHNIVMSDETSVGELSAVLDRLTKRLEALTPTIKKYYKASPQ